MKPLTFSILRLLNDGKFHSGVTMAQHLNVSRTSVSNALRRLEEKGVVVHRIHGRGYRLPNPVQWLDKNKIIRYFSTKKEKLHIEILDTTQSTNTELIKKATTKEYSDNKTDIIHVIATELQTNGRGRRGQIWYSGLGDSLTFSLLWNFQKGAGILSGLSLAIGIAIIRSLKLSGIKNIALKWPNDIMHQHHKIAGILIELRGDSLGPTLAIIGIGINLKLSDNIKKNIDQDSTDLFSISGKTLDRNKLMANLLSELTIILKEFTQHGFKPFKNEWIQYHELENEQVTLYLPDNSVQKGTVQGITNNGSLILKTVDGMRYFNGGNIKLRRVT
ncbi:MAG: biotin--[acetyl-CoA-carboxylase] ligase [Nitrosomonadaceae bacterium]|nr:biotin--[acetyl-CoA-carboxylase] ligase [Nitrosomonadaceae bacterium]|tara:strand:- start:653 stop:1648 length:996 start_codon:yes stop_codon:yes gene_type:complete